MRLQELLRLGETNAERFRNAQPFPHIYLDNVFPQKILHGVSREFPEIKPTDALHLSSNKGCMTTGERFKCSLENSGGREGSRLMSTPYARSLYSLLLSPDFVYFLEALTGIQGIISDNSFTGSGFDQTLPGGGLAVHTDFHFNGALKLTRRVNVFIYLNPEWKESYGGHLELWPRNLSACARRILPSLGRLAMFSSTDFSFHGHPRPLRPPPGRMRRSLALYYYTPGPRPPGECEDGDCETFRNADWQSIAMD